MYMYARHMHTRSHTQTLSLAAAAGFEVNRIGVDEAKARVRHSYTQHVYMAMLAAICIASCA